MANRLARKLGGLTFVAAIAVALLAAPILRLASHDPLALAHAEIERHAVLEVAPASDHGHASDHDQHHDRHHAHGHGQPDERHPGHSHGHNAGDHSHDVPAPARLQSHLPPTIDATREIAAVTIVDLGLAFGIDRPPQG